MEFIKIVQIGPSVAWMLHFSETEDIKIYMEFIKIVQA